MNIIIGNPPTCQSLPARLPALFGSRLERGRSALPRPGSGGAFGLSPRSRQAWVTCNISVSLRKVRALGILRNVRFPVAPMESHQSRCLLCKDWVLIIQSLQLAIQGPERFGGRPWKQSSHRLPAALWEVAVSWSGNCQLPPEALIYAWWKQDESTFDDCWNESAALDILSLSQCPRPRPAQSSRLRLTGCP